VIGEASLPDVDSGYFIHSSATAAEHFREYGPAPIDGEPIALVFASGGGGHLFAIGASGQVWRASWFDDFVLQESSNNSAAGSRTRPDHRSRTNGPLPQEVIPQLGNREQVWGPP
jgi:hypothetical protein